MCVAPGRNRPDSLRRSPSKPEARSSRSPSSDDRVWGVRRSASDRSRIGESSLPPKRGRPGLRCDVRTENGADHADEDGERVCASRCTSGCSEASRCGLRGALGEHVGSADGLARIALRPANRMGLAKSVGHAVASGDRRLSRAGSIARTSASRSQRRISVKHGTVTAAAISADGLGAAQPRCIAMVVELGPWTTCRMGSERRFLGGPYVRCLGLVLGRRLAAYARPGIGDEARRDGGDTFRASRSGLQAMPTPMKSDRACPWEMASRQPEDSTTDERHRSVSILQIEDN